MADEQNLFRDEILPVVIESTGFPVERTDQEIVACFDMIWELAEGVAVSHASGDVTVRINRFHLGVRSQQRAITSMSTCRIPQFARVGKFNKFVR